MRKGLTLCALLIAAPACAASDGPGARILAAHNAERAAMGLEPLSWSGRLAADALDWAKHLATSKRFEHAPPGEGQQAQGENLWMGTSGAFTPEDMVSAWLNERQDYQDGAFPAVSRTGNWRDVGHYTQIVWHNTRQIGCAIASNANDDILVCRYDPPGNWMGHFPTRAGNR